MPSALDFGCAGYERRSHPRLLAGHLCSAQHEGRNARKRREVMNFILWIIAGYLAAAFVVAGATKLFIPQETLAKAPGAGWVLNFSAGFVKALGVVEILGAIGLILPALLDIAPIMVPLAAV